MALKWWRRARRIFRAEPEDLRSLGSEIMLIGAFPLENLGDSPWGSTDVIALRSRRDFEPEIARLGECVSIGSGSVVPKYRELLEARNRDPFQLA